ncbi:MAG: DUF3592 domain-containing protein [Dermatophilaceae bacterium]|nr:DUF3592 domain-containing protein [Actinomycetales bacterium]MBP8882193.1 DUF3592 domain-containing protein [Dermatophilaceae bacterium]MBP9920037.1 DUF3592 domain-containing protein [Dermatophilaceae bacterium]
MNAAGEIAGALIGLVWLVMGVWMVAIGRRRTAALGGWVAAEGTIVDRHGDTDGLLVRNPHVRYVAPDGSEHVVASKSRGDLWEPGQAVDIRVNPANPAEAMLDTHAGRAQAYLVVGWFIIVVAILTFVGSALLAWATPR